MVKNGMTIPWGQKTKVKVLELRSQGRSRKEITALIGVSKSSQLRFEHLASNRDLLAPKLKNHKGLKNPNSRVTEAYLDRLKEIIRFNNTKTNAELQAIMEEVSDQRVPYSTFCKYVVKVHGTRKQYRTQYSEGDRYRGY
jgi:hypothetical protein